MEEKPKKIERWSYPFKAKGSGTGASSEVTDPQIYYEALAKAESGYYPVANNGLWHGGVHFDQNTAAMLDQSSVRCIADGVVIAYRIDDNYKKLTYTGSGTSKEVTYSTGFVLVKHRLELPPDPAATTPSTATPPAAEPDLTFYSLYMHLMDWKTYGEEGAPTPPSFMCPIHYAVSEEHANNDFSGLYVRGGAPGTSEHGNRVAIIPKGCRVKVGEPSSIDPRWRKLVSILEGKAFPALAPEIEHWVFPGEMTPTTDDDVFLTGEGANDVKASLLPGKGLTVRKEAKQHSAAMAVLPVDAQVLLEDGTGSFRKIKSIVASTLTSPLSPECAPNIAGYIHFDSLKAIPQSPTLRTVQVLETPVPIQAGALIGHLGKYQAASQSEAHDLLHLEVFSLDDVEAFVTQSRARANQLKPEQKTLLKIPTGTTVITQEGASPTDLPLPPGQPTAYDMILPLAVLNALPADRKITLITTADDITTTEQWWKLDNLPGKDGNPISGWVKEGELMTSRYHPWDWEGFDFIKETGTLDAMYVCKLSAEGVLDDGEKTNYQAQINTADSGPIRERLYSIIDLNNDEKLTYTEIKDALTKPWHAQSISRLIVQYESEWHAEKDESEKLIKWEALNCYMIKEGNSDWAQEKERIRSLLWWHQLSEPSMTRSKGVAIHFCPTGLISTFNQSACACNRDITANELRKITPEISDDLINEYLDPINQGFTKFGINTCRGKAHFIAQLLHESDNLKATSEYGGEETSYAPWYGRGLMQVTGQENYIKYQVHSGEDVTSTPSNKDKLKIPPHSALSAFWFYCKYKNLDIVANNDDFNLVTAKINGGYIGYNERLILFKKAVKALNADHLNKLEKNKKFLFEESGIYNNKVSSLGWALWHDPASTKLGVTKDAAISLRGYQRARQLITANPFPNDPDTKIYGIRYSDVSSHVNSRIAALSEA